MQTVCRDVVDAGTGASTQTWWKRPTLTANTSSFSRHIPSSPYYRPPSLPAASPAPHVPLSLCSRRPWTAAKSWMICRFPPGTECSSCHGTSLRGLRPASAGPRSYSFCFSGERSTRSCKLNPGESIPDTCSVKSCILDETNFYCSVKDNDTFTIHRCLSPEKCPQQFGPMPLQCDSINCR